MNKRPITLEFTGPPCSGKTTLICDLANYLSRNDFKVKIMQEDAEEVPTCIPKKTWVRNTWITFGQLQSLIEAPFLDADIILFDRGFYDALFWSKFLKDQGLCTEEESKSFYTMLQELNNQFGFEPDHLFVIDVSVEESLKRRQSLGGDIVYTTAEFVTAYKKSLSSFYESISSPKVLINTSDMEPDIAKDFVLAELYDRKMI